MAMEKIEREDLGVEQLLTIAEVARLLKLSQNYVAALARDDRLHGIRPGGTGKWRFTPQAVRRFIGQP